MAWWHGVLDIRNSTFSRGLCIMSQFRVIELGRIEVRGQDDPDTHARPAPPARPAPAVPVPYRRAPTG